MAEKLGGRPRHGAEAKKAPLNMRTDPELRKRIEAAARNRNLSLTQEVERRLRQSFILEKAGPGLEFMAHITVHSAEWIQRHTGERVTRSRVGWEALRLVSMYCLKLLRPLEDLDADRYRQELGELALRQRELQDRASEVNQRYSALQERGEDASQAAAEYGSIQDELTLLKARYAELRPLYDKAREELTDVEKRAGELAKEAISVTHASTIAALRAAEEAAMIQEQIDGA